MHILLVEDDCTVLKYEQILLRKLGHQVDGFLNPLEALNHFRSAPFKYDLVVTDLYMPSLNGNQLAREIKALRPCIPVVICSGDLILKSDCGCVIDGHIHKPFSAGALNDLITELSGKDSSPAFMAV